MSRLRADHVFAPDFVVEPLWWQDAALEAGDDRPLPARVDVAVIGSGYCGLAVALELARAGVHVAVFDTGALLPARHGPLRSKQHRRHPAGPV
jgi:NADPH-dependent 2,4-dienoyl-CoA reductase/sulfur reductase-like enzyme